MLNFVIEFFVEKALDKVIDEGARQEWVRRTLQQFGIESNNPPADFDGIYVSTLIQYGVGKPIELLRFFRDEIIRQEFERAFKSNNYNHLHDEAGHVLEWNKVGEDLRRIDIDPRREFAAFTLVFLDQVEQTLTPADIKVRHEVSEQTGKLEVDIRTKLDEKIDHLQRTSQIVVEMADLHTASLERIEQIISKVARFQKSQTTSLSGVPAKGTSDEYIKRRLDNEIHVSLLNRNHIGICGPSAGLAGMGGVGKTEMAIQIALNLKDQFSAGVLWVNFGERDVESIVHDMGQRLGVAINPNEDIHVWVNDMKRALELHERLLIYDDVRTKHLPNFKDYFLPPSNCALLVTTRLQQLHALPVGALHPLDIFTPDQSEILLRTVLSNEICNRESHVLYQIGEFCGHLPLAINVSARHILRIIRIEKDNLQPIATYVKLLESQKSKLLEALQLPSAEFPLTCPRS